MKAAILHRAWELGFDDCRVTTAQAPASGPALQAWLEEGKHGEMAYLERNAPKRRDPQLVLRGARSILTLAVSYGGSEECRGTGETELGQAGISESSSSVRRTDRASPAGVIARYARYRDYHKVIGERLKLLTQYIQELGGPETRSLWYVDTGPLLERDLAQRAGLGFIGKHTNLISRRLGNWLFLSEILTTVELEPDEAERNHCGSCTRCITACPTGAITAPFELDARRCISYLTIELKGAIPEEFRSALGLRVFGCDDCLEACPWNRFARQGRLMGQHARTQLHSADLLELLALHQAGFEERFAATPVARLKRKGLLRNVCVALGNAGDEQALSALEKASHDAEPLIAEHALWAIGQIQSKKAAPP
jgi:epoxyqueuosine reductase